MENKKDIFKLLIPVIAVIVVVESVLVVSGLNKKSGEFVDESATPTSEPTGEVDVNPVASFVFSIDSKTMKIGDKYNMEVTLLPKESFSLDAVDLYVSYDTEAFDVTGLSESSDMPTATSKQISEKRGIVLSNFWFMDEAGFSFEAGKPVSLISFSVTPKKAGQFSFSLNSQADLGQTKLVTSEDNVRSLPYVSDALMVLVEE